MTIYVDIDNTICYYADADKNALNYNLAIPIVSRIEQINKLFDLGHTIIYWTARGAITGIDWTEVTTIQLRQWGCKYSLLRTDKPAYDLFIDDKNINSETYFESHKLQ